MPAIFVDSALDNLSLVTASSAIFAVVTESSAGVAILIGTDFATMISIAKPFGGAVENVNDEPDIE